MPSAIPFPGQAGSILSPGQMAPQAAGYTCQGLMGLVLREPGMTVQVHSPELEPDGGGRVGLQRAADLLLGAKMHSSQILWEGASSLFILHNVGAVQNLADSASRDKYMPLFLGHLLPDHPSPIWLSEPWPPPFLALFPPTPFELV